MPAAQRGDRQAVDHLLTAFRQPIFALALSFLKDPHEAEVAAQEVFLRVFSRIRTLKKPKRFRSWCLTITANYCRDRLRARPLNTKPLEEAPEPVAPSPDPGLSERLRQGLASLNPVLRQALVLRDVEAFSYREISEIQKAALGTVKSRIYEARRKLKKWIKTCDVKR